MERTLVKVTMLEYCIEFRLINRRRKSRRFLLTRDEFTRLEDTSTVISRDIGNYMELCRDRNADTLFIRFTWLSGSDDSIKGYEDTVTVCYSELAAFVAEHPEEGAECRLLSIDTSARRPRLVFSRTENLHAAVEHPVIRRKLSRAMRDNFNWPRSEEIVFFNDFVPYSFFWREFRNGQSVMCGGLILHGQGNMSKAYYGIHT